MVSSKNQKYFYILLKKKFFFNKSLIVVGLLRITALCKLILNQKSNIVNIYVYLSIIYLFLYFFQDDDELVKDELLDDQTTNEQVDNEPIVRSRRKIRKTD